MKSIKICRFRTFRVGYLEFVVIKRFGRESLHVQPSFGLDVVEYIVKCMFS